MTTKQDQLYVDAEENYKLELIHCRSLPLEELKRQYHAYHQAWHEWAQRAWREVIAEKEAEVTR